jgi:hypothetical protein
MDAIVSGPTEHCHAPNPDQAPVLDLKNKIKARAADSEEPSSTILHSVMRSLPLDSAGQLPKSQTLLRTIRRQRQAVPAGPDNKLPDHLKQTDRGENFVLHEDKDLIIFTTDSNLSVLKTCKHWFADGTFSVRKYDLLCHRQLFHVIGVPRGVLPDVHVTWIVQITDYSIGLWTAYRKENF